jgi:hypothetical protein
MFYIDLWGFPNGPLYFGYNSVEHESNLCIFLTSRDLNEDKWTCDFLRFFYAKKITWNT